MGILGIGSYNNAQQYVRSTPNQNGYNIQKSTSTNITLCLHDEEGNKAINCVGFPNGGSASVFKSDTYTEDNPQYVVKYWDGSGEEQEKIVNPKEVNPSNASYLEMLAYSAYLDEQGYTTNAFSDFTMSAMGTDVSVNYDETNINEKVDFKIMVKKFMDMQYNAGNLAAYLSFKRLFDCMNES